MVQAIKEPWLILEAIRACNPVAAREAMGSHQARSGLLAFQDEVS